MRSLTCSWTSGPAALTQSLEQMRAARVRSWISARLQHPNVIRFHDFVFHEGRHHLVVEYVPGCDLAAAARACFAEGRPFPLEVAIEIGGERRTGRARIVTDPDEDAAARWLVVEKYAPRYRGDLEDWGRTSLPVAIEWSEPDAR